MPPHLLAKTPHTSGDYSSGLQYTPDQSRPCKVWLPHAHPCVLPRCVLAVEGPSGQLAIVKQALPYVRAVGESFPLSRVRASLPLQHPQPFASMSAPAGTMPIWKCTHPARRSPVLEPHPAVWGGTTHASSCNYHPSLLLLLLLACPTPSTGAYGG